MAVKRQLRSWVWRRDAIRNLMKKLWGRSKGLGIWWPLRTQLKKWLTFVTSCTITWKSVRGLVSLQLNRNRLKLCFSMLDSMKKVKYYKWTRSCNRTSIKIYHSRQQRKRLLRGWNRRSSITEGVVQTLMWVICRWDVNKDALLINR